MNQKVKPTAPKPRTKRAPAMELEPKQPQLPATVGAPSAYPQPAPSMAMNLIATAVNNGRGVEEIDKLMQLLERQQADERRQNYYLAMATFKQQLDTIYKNAGANYTAKNRTTGDKVEVNYDYATLGHICEAIISELAKHGIVHDWKIEQPGEGPDAGWIVTTCVLTHVHGHSNAATVKFMADPTGSKNPLQAIGSGVTYGERYSLLAACGIAVKEQGDDDANSAGAHMQNGEAPSTDTQRAPSRPRKPKDLAAGKHKKPAEASPELLQRARNAADKGRASFTKFWKEAVTAEERAALSGEMDDFERRIKAGDKAGQQGDNFARRMDQATGSAK